MGFRDQFKSSSIEQLTGEMEKITKKSQSFKDERFWKPELDSSGNGFAIIRFLAPPEGEDVPWARVFSHAFQGPGGWYIENCLTTINKSDPVAEANSLLWQTGLESDKQICRDRKRKLSYMTNILVLHDPANPQNEGKVFLYRFGKKIFDKISESMNPAFADETAINPFDFWEGANFKLKIRKVDGYSNYDKCEFEPASPLFDDDNKIEAIWKTQYPLLPFTDESNFKSYEELSARFKLVTRSAVPNTTAESYAPNDNQGVSYREPKPKVETSEEAPFNTTSEPVEESDAVGYFEKLAQED